MARDEGCAPAPAGGRPALIWQSRGKLRPVKHWALRSCKSHDLDNLTRRGIMSKASEYSSMPIFHTLHPSNTSHLPYPPQNKQEQNSDPWNKRLKATKKQTSQKEWAREAKDLLGFAVPALAGNFLPWISHSSHCLWLVLKPVGA